MKIILVCLLWVCTFGLDIEEEIQIAGNKYSILHESYNEYGDKGIVMKLYSKEANKDALPLLSFTLENQSGNCAEKSIQNGTYEIHDTILTLYTHWDRVGRAYDSPRGDRIQHYVFDKNGTVTFLDGLLYIERQARSYDKESGLKYLYKTPKNKAEKEKLQAYIKSTERIFGGKFVFGKEAKLLHNKVAQALLKKKQTRWK